MREDRLELYANKIWSGIWVIILPIGISALTAMLLQGAGINLPGFSESESQRHWGGQLLIFLILFVWLRSVPSVFTTFFRKQPILVLTKNGVSVPDQLDWTWDEIASCSESFGTLKIKSKEKKNPTIALFATQCGAAAQSRAIAWLKTHAPPELTEKL